MGGREGALGAGLVEGLGAFQRPRLRQQGFQVVFQEEVFGAATGQPPVAGVLSSAVIDSQVVASECDGDLAADESLPVHVQVVAFDADTGQLDLLPDSAAYATQLRLLSPRIIAAGTRRPVSRPCTPFTSCPPVRRPRTPERLPRTEARGTGKDPRHGLAQLPPGARRAPSGRATLPD